MKLSIISICLMIGLVGFFLYLKRKPSYGAVIILNGPSGSGKSSIQKEFQKIMMPALWIKLGIDNLFDGPMPDITMENINYWQSPNQIRWVEESRDAENNKLITLFVGSQGEKVAYGMNSAIADYAKNGCNIIVDYIAYKQEWLSDLQKKLENIPTLYVAVEISLETLEKREEARGTSPRGHARSHYFTVYGNQKYDLRVNSQNKSAHEIAQELKIKVSESFSSLTQ
ncbi:MAG: AAA family ATPase [Candidatus Dependentiae bacterium]|nr:AAA family ATPase [Candidatus Dependentiae bacterium]